MAPCINAFAQHIDPYDATMLGQVIQGGGKDRKSPKSDANHLSFGLAHRVSWVRVRGESGVMRSAIEARQLSLPGCKWGVGRSQIAVMVIGGMRAFVMTR